MLSLNEYTSFDAIGLAELIRNGETTTLELLDCAIALTEKLNPTLNAVVVKDYEAARQIARAPEALNPGPLSGVPFLIKDISEVRGLPQTRGSRLFANEIAKADSAVAARFREAGLLLFGKTNTPELCLTITTEPVLYGACHNPAAPAHSAGGSSGGAAAAVAAGIVPAAHGSDGGGSIRVPASCCGLVGLKPSRGLTVTEHDAGGSWSGLSVHHVLSRTVRDSAAFLDVLRHRPDRFPHPFPHSCLDAHAAHPGRLRVAVQRAHPAGFPVHEDCLTAVEKAAAMARQHGFALEDAAPPVDYAKLSRAMTRIVNIHVAQIIMPALAQRNIALEEAPIEEATRRMADAGSRSSALEYIEALDVLRQAEIQMAEFHQQYDLVLSPVLAMPPAELGWLAMNSKDMKTYGKRFAAYSGFAALYNGTGQPSISLPLHRNAAGLPIGVMFSGAWGMDHQLLQVANLLLQSAA